MKNKFFNFKYLYVLTASFLPLSALALPNYPIVTCNTSNCGFNDFIVEVNTFINFLLFDLATPLFAIIFCYAGFLYLTSGGSQENVKKAKHIIRNALVGYIIGLCAWIIIKTILLAFGFNPKDAFLNV